MIEYVYLCSMILVTGGTGLLGTYLLYELTKRGEKVRVLLRPGKRPYEIEKLFSCFDNPDHSLYSLLEWAEGDLLDLPSLDAAMEGINQVYHCAAYISFDPRDFNEMQQVNVEGTANVVNMCLKHKVKKLCYVSSIAALGQMEHGNTIDETARWKTSRYNSGYAISKYGGEREVWRGIEEGLEGVIVNPSVILGAGCHPKATNRLFHSIKHLLLFYNDGVNGYVDVRDVAQACILLMNNSISGERFVLNSENISLRQLFDIAAEILGKPKPFIPIGKTGLSILWRLEWIRSRITGKRAMITRENLRAATSKSYYSSAKYLERFQNSFIPVRQSLEDAFAILDKMKNTNKAGH